MKDIGSRKHTDSFFPLRVCTCCSQELTLSFFYEREKGQRWDSKCKACRKEDRRFEYQSKANSKKGKENRPKRIIEPKEDAGNNFKPNINETNTLVAEMDFTDMEKHYGLQLSYVEKNDATQRFNEFISILREEYGKQLGCKVYVTKD